MTIGDHLLEALRLHKKISRKSEREYILDMLEKVRFINPQYRLKQYPHELSGGMKQRVCIAMALFSNPSLLIADEFTTALDVTIQQEIINTVKELQKQLHISILFITHDLALIYNTCKYVAIMYAGEIVEKGEVKKVFRNPSHPYTQALLNSVTVISSKSGKLKSLKGFVPSLIDPPSGCRFNTRCKYKIENVCEKTFPGKTVVEEGHEVWCYLFNK